MGNEPLFELIEELKEEKILGAQGLLSDDSLHGLYVLADSITGILKGGIRLIALQKKFAAHGHPVL